MDMVKRFVEIEHDEYGVPIELNIDEAARRLKKEQPQSKNYKLFQGKKISRKKKIMYEHFGKYPTIEIDFGEVQGSNFEENLASLRTVVHNAFLKHAYLLKADLWNRQAFNINDFMEYFELRKSKLKTVEEIKTGLVLLSRFLHAHYGRRVFVFIEEFDVPVNGMVYENDMKPKQRKKTIKLLQLMIRNLLKGSDNFVVRSLSNACQQLGGILSGSANNVRLCPFLQKHSLVEFYGFHKYEVIDLLKRAGLSDNLNKVTEMYNGYKAKLKNGDLVEISSPWAIVQFIRTEEYAKYWSAGIPDQIEAVIGNLEIRSKIKQMMSGESVKIVYKDKLQIADIHSLNEIICETEISERNVNLTLQFLYEMGFFTPTFIEKDCLKLTTPNDSVRMVLDDILYRNDVMEKYFDHLPADIKNFTDSTKSVAITCMKRSKKTEDIDHTKSNASIIKQKFYELANKIKILFNSGKHRPDNEREFQSGLYHYLRQRFGNAAIERHTIDGKVCDIVVVIEGFMFIIEIKHFRESAEGAHDQLLNNKYYTLAEEKLVKKVFRENTPTVKDHIRMGLHRDQEGEISIAYTFKDTPLKERVLVSTKDQIKKKSKKTRKTKKNK
ncbi:hypothetical protein PV328_000252 [Microctonus aethiopoides]|uniref:NERD domain-containing protein n=1 Tax=Microctonus aethiopoides TaxID=144406 RepID=A0AA39FUV2_9HYME|nr:hypothetical protein PV328_000252 [Microctonus aethiopoides]